MGSRHLPVFGPPLGNVPLRPGAVECEVCCEATGLKAEAEFNVSITLSHGVEELEVCEAHVDAFARLDPYLELLDRASDLHKVLQ